MTGTAKPGLYRIFGAVCRKFGAVSALLSGFAQAAVIGALRLYKLVLSPLFPSACRFHPTCSEYMRDAVQEYGAAKGVWMGLRRLSRCHPLHQGGYDPVR